MEAMKQKAKEEIEKQMGDNMPGILKPLAACMGPVKTMETFITE